MPSDSEDELDVAWEILRYFAHNPEAADTVEGVARWRLLDERIRSSVEQVTRAMKWLAAQGLLVKEELPGSRTAFRLNQEAKPRIEDLLKQDKTRPKKQKKH